MAAHTAARSLSLFTRCQRQYCFHQQFLHFLNLTPLLSVNKPQHRLFYAGIPSLFPSCALKLAAPLSPESNEIDSDDTAKKTWNSKTRDARRAVRWAEELTELSPAQIKPILRAASLGPEVLDSIMVAKRLIRHVREGKRRQIINIGKLLHQVDTELMEELMQATRDGDTSKLQSFSASEELAEVDEEENETKSEDEVQGNPIYNEIATRSFDSLVRLVRQLYVSEEEKEREEDAKIELTKFVKNLAKQLPIE